MLNVPAIVVLLVARARSRPAVVGVDRSRRPSSCTVSSSLRATTLRAARHRLAGRLGGRHLDLRHLRVYPPISSLTFNAVWFPAFDRRWRSDLALCGLGRSWRRRRPPAPCHLVTISALLPMVGASARFRRDGGVRFAFQRGGPLGMWRDRDACRCRRPACREPSHRCDCLPAGVVRRQYLVGVFSIGAGA